MPTSSVSSGQILPGATISGGAIVDVLSGGTLSGAAILSGGSAIIEVGGVDSGSTISFGGSEIVYGSANLDIVAGLQTVSTGTTAGLVTNETVVNGGTILLSIKTTSALNTTISSGGALDINGAISATNTTISAGGIVALQSAKATLTGALVFAGGGTLDVTANTSAGSGDLAVISGFAAGAAIDMTSATTIGAAASASVTTAISGGNTVATVSGGGATDTYIFAGTTIGTSLVLTSDGAGGRELIVSGAPAAVTSVGSGQTQSNVVVNSGAPLTVYAGGTIVGATILSGGLATINAGGVDTGATISAGGTETLLGLATGDTILGTQTISGGNATGDVVQSGGVINLNGTGSTLTGAVASSGGTIDVSANATITNTTIAGGTVNLLAPSAAISGGFTFNGPGTLNVTTLPSIGAGETSVMSGFYVGDIVNILPIGTGGTLSTTISGGNTVATVTSGGVSETLTFAGAVASNLLLTSSGGAAEIAYTGPVTTTAYTAGDLVLSIYGNGAGTGTVGLDQAAPITLEEITTTGAVVSQQVLTQQTTVVNGVTEYAISGEYQSASEGILNLAANGQSLVITGYGVNAAAFNAANGASIYGTVALGQTTSLLGGQYTAVERVVADIGYNAVVDTSTSLSGIFNTNNPRSVTTVNGTEFYLGGQGNGADGTEGVFLAADGSSSATAIFDTKTDVRDVALYNGQLYVSVDSKLNAGGGLYTFAAGLPTSATIPTVLPGISTSVVLAAGQGNSVNGAAIGTSVNLSPEQYFFANSTTVYVADGGVPKEGGLGDGGLQKWSLVGGTWKLDYTLSTGLNQVADTATTGTTGLVGLTGVVQGGNVVFYTTNETVAETDPSYLYGITDALAATSLPTDESFTVLETAAPGTLIRGVAFAPTASSTSPQVTSAITVSSGVTSSGLTVASGGSILVMSGGTIVGTTLLSGALTSVSVGGVDSATFVAHGATETMLGAASFDIIDGIQLVSAATAVVTSETVENGGSLELFLKGAIASATTVNSGGTLNISGNATAVNTVISGGALLLNSPKAVISGGLTFIGTSGSIDALALSTAGYGDLAPITGFGASDVIDERLMGTATVLSTTVSGGNVVATLTSGTVVENFTFTGSGQTSGASYASGLSLVSDTLGGVELVYTPPLPVNLIVSSGVTSTGISVTSGNSITVLSGGTMSGITISAGGSAVIAVGGSDIGSTIQAGGYEVVSGDANGDQIYGIQNVTTGGSAGALPATVENETVFNGGSLQLYLKPDVATNITVSSGGQFLLSGNVSATNTTLDSGAYMALQSPKAVFNGGLVLNGPATIAITAITSAGFGDLGVISGWGVGDVIDETLITPGQATLVTTTSGGNTVETINGSTFPESFIFAGNAVAANIAMVADASGGVQLIDVACFCTGTNIRTTQGDVAVERLAVGDMVITAAGAERPIKWIGQRTLRMSDHPNASDLMPIRIAADAFGPGLPMRNLLLSGEHAIHAEGVLIPVRELINDGSIHPVEVSDVTYWHVELETHDILLAEGLPAESYLENGNRGDFEGGETLFLQPRFIGSNGNRTMPCAPVKTQGLEVEWVRDLLLERMETVRNVALAA